MTSEREYTGSLYKSDPTTKGWAQIGGGPVNLKIIPGSGGKWQLVAKQGKEKVWECDIESNFKHKLRDNFVQWIQEKEGKMKQTFGLRIKDTVLAQQFSDALTSALTNPPRKQSQAISSTTTKQDDKLLKIILPSKEYLILPFNSRATMIQILKQVTLQQLMDTSLYVLAASSNSGPVSLKPSTTVGELKSSELLVVRRQRPPGMATVTTEKPHQETHTVPLDVTIPSGDTYTLNVNPSITLSDLLGVVSERSGLSRFAHRFDLPIANQDKVRLQQLKCSAITVVRKEGVSDGKTGLELLTTEVTDGGGVSPRTALKMKAKKAPPPPPSSPKQNQQLVKELRHRSDSGPSSFKCVQDKKYQSDYIPSSHHEAIDGEDVNDFVSKMLSEHAVSNSSPLMISSTKPGSPLKQRGDTSIRQKPPSPAPPPPTRTKDSSKTSIQTESTRHKAGSVKRTAPPPPKGSSESTDSIEQKPSQEKKSHLTQFGIALPSMTKQHILNSDKSPKSSPTRSRRPGNVNQPQLKNHDLSPQIIRRTGSLDTPDTPPKFRAPPPKSPPPYPSQKKPIRKAPNKPPSQPPKQKDSQNQNLVSSKPPLDHKEVVALSENKVLSSKPSNQPQTHVNQHTIKSSPQKRSSETEFITTSKSIALVPEHPISPGKRRDKIIVVSPNKGKVINPVGSFLFKIPPPPSQNVPKRPVNPPIVAKEGSPRVQPIHHIQQEEDEDEEESSTTSGSSVGGYDVGSGLHLDREDISPSSKSSSNESETGEEDNIGEEEWEEVDSLYPEALTQIKQQESKIIQKEKPQHISSSLPLEPESSSDEEEEENGILLLSHLHTKSDPDLLEDQELEGKNEMIEEAIHNLTHLNKEQTSTEIEGEKEKKNEKKDIRSELHTLDNMIASLRNLVADTCEIGGKDELGGEIQHQDSFGSETNFDITVIKKMAPPPDTTPTIISTTPVPPPPPVAPKPSKVSESSKVPPPTIKPKPIIARKPTSEVIVDDELALKLKQRQQNIESKENPPVQTEIQKDQESDMTSKQLQESIEKSSENAKTMPVMTDVSHSPVSSNTVSTSLSSQTGGEMQAQLQMLQQQVLQQQMMQLQQQFQQMQQLMAAQQSAFNPVYMQQMQQMQAGLQASFPVQSGTIPTIPQQTMMNAQQPLPTALPLITQPSLTTSLPLVGQPLLGASLPVMGQTSSMQFPQLQLLPQTVPVTVEQYVSMATNQPIMTPSIYQPPVDQRLSTVSLPPLYSSHSPDSPNHTSTPVPQAMSRRYSEADVRSIALGEVEENFDNLMEQVRDTDPNEMLKKVPEKNDDKSESPYTGMTAALVEAMKERRKHFSHNSSSISKQESTDETSDSWDDS